MEADGENHMIVFILGVTERKLQDEKTVSGKCSTH